MVLLMTLPLGNDLLHRNKKKASYNMCQKMLCLPSSRHFVLLTNSLILTLYLLLDPLPLNLVPFGAFNKEYLSIKHICKR